jgi:hypothetical protein
VAELVDHRLPDLLHGFGPRVRDAIDRTAENDDLVGKERRVVAALRQRNPAIDP